MRISRTSWLLACIVGALVPVTSTPIAVAGGIAPMIAGMSASRDGKDAAMLSAVISPEGSEALYTFVWEWHYTIVGDNQEAHVEERVTHAVPSTDQTYTASTQIGDLPFGASLRFWAVATNGAGQTTSTARSLTTRVPREVKIPAKTQGLLLEKALETASFNGDEHPYDIEALKTSDGRQREYMVAMRGDFVCNSCKGPRREGEHETLTGSAILLGFARTSLEQFTFTLGGYGNLQAEYGVTPALLAPETQESEREREHEEMLEMEEERQFERKQEEK